MNLVRAKSLQKKMPHKKIYLDTILKCYRLIDPNELYEYKDEQGRTHKRKNVEGLQLKP